MTNEELMQPRFKVIAIYPQMNFKVGDILTTSKQIPQDSIGIFIDHVTEYAWVYTPNDYPHLFKKLEWWEGRKEEDMPKYIKFEWNGKVDEVRKVKEWLREKEWDKTKSTPINGFTHQSDFDSELFPRVSLNGWIPSTEEEWISFETTNKTNIQNQNK